MKKSNAIKRVELLLPFAIKAAWYTSISFGACLAILASLLLAVSRTTEPLVPWRTFGKGSETLVQDLLLLPPEDGGEAFPTYSSDGSGCEEYTGQERQFCEIHVGKRAEMNFQAYRSSLGTCDTWREQDPHDNPDFMYMHLKNEELSSGSASAHFGYDYSQSKLNEFRHKLSMKTCETAEDDTHFWTFVRLGPFRSTGGYDWHRHLFPDIGSFSKKAPAYVTGFMAAAVDAKGNVLGMPPIHIHHTHTATNQCWGLRYLYSGVRPPVDTLSMRDRQDPAAELMDWEFDTHGDRECLRNNGHTACLLQTQPAGYGQLVEYPLCSLGDWNDMRPAGSPELEFWIENAFRWTKAQQNQLGFMTMAIGINFDASYSIVSEIVDKIRNEKKMGEEPTLYDDYLIPAQDSLLWGSFTVDFSAKWASMFLHTHHLWTLDMLFFRGSPEELGLNKAPFVLRRSDQPLLLAEIGLTVLEIKRYIYNNLKQQKCGHAKCPKLVCQMNQNRFEKNETLPAGLMGGVLSRKYERFAYPQCSMDEFHEGDTFTLVSFHGVVEGAPPPREGVSRMHSVVYAKYLPIPPATTIRANAHLKQNEFFLPMFRLPHSVISETSSLLLQLFRQGFHSMV